MKVKRFCMVKYREYFKSEEMRLREIPHYWRGTSKKSKEYSCIFMPTY